MAIQAISWLGNSAQRLVNLDTSFMICSMLLNLGHGASVGVLSWPFVSIQLQHLGSAQELDQITNRSNNISSKN
jgi:hypothetical protein